MLIRGAEVWGHGQADVRLVGETIAALGGLEPLAGEPVIEAAGGALLPGLHDHHIHLAALAAARESVRCGPPEVRNPDDLARTLSRSGEGWLRGVGYHESVAGMLEAAMLDRWVPDRPVRVQHRSGRMWFLNTLALDLLLETEAAPAGLDRATGRLFDEDRWLRRALGGRFPALGAVSAELAASGVTGLSDMSPANDGGVAQSLAGELEARRLVQDCVLAGTLALDQAPLPAGLALGPAKLHLHDAALPDPAAAVGFVAAAHAQGRPVAVHCTTEAELVFALSAIAEAGPRQGDRIEHAGIAPDHLVEEVARLRLHVVTQPHFIAERGDRYLLEVEPADRPFLYRARAFLDAGVTLAAGSDAPFGSADPWAAMRAAVSRQTAGGAFVGAEEALTAEEALALYFADPLDLATERRIAPGAAADLCLLRLPWRQARSRLLADDVGLTLVKGRIVHQRIDQSPGQRGSGVDPPP